MEMLMTITFWLLVIGGVNWGLWGAAGVDLVAAVFGGNDKPLAKLVYVAVGISAVAQLLSHLEIM